MRRRTREAVMLKKPQPRDQFCTPLYEERLKSIALRLVHEEFGRTPEGRGYKTGYELAVEALKDLPDFHAADERSDYESWDVEELVGRYGQGFTGRDVAEFNATQAWQNTFDIENVIVEGAWTQCAVGHGAVLDIAEELENDLLAEKWCQRMSPAWNFSVHVRPVWDLESLLFREDLAVSDCFVGWMIDGTLQGVIPSADAVRALLRGICGAA